MLARRRDSTARAVDELPALPPSVLLGTATRAPISADDAVGGAADAGAGGGDYGGVGGEGVSSLIPSACVPRVRVAALRQDRRPRARVRRSARRGALHRAPLLHLAARSSCGTWSSRLALTTSRRCPSAWRCLCSTRYARAVTARPRASAARLFLIGRHDLARQQLQHAETRPYPVSLPSHPAGAPARRRRCRWDGLGRQVVGAALLGRPTPQRVRRLLCSSRLALRLSATPELTDHDLIHGSSLGSSSSAGAPWRCRWGVACSLSPRRRLASPRRCTAPLTLKGRMPSNAATIDPASPLCPTTSSTGPSSTTAPPPRSGCALPAAAPQTKASWAQLDRVQQARSRQHSHAGFLLGLGLQGHLLALANTDLYRYMSQGHGGR